MKGSTRKPLAQQKGHLNISVIQQRRAEEEAVKTGSEEILKPPAWMKDKVARREWKRIIPQLLKIEVVGNLDLANIAGYCVSFANYQKATAELEEQQLVTSDRSNPYIDVQAKYAQEMRRFGELCGMSVGARLKAAATKTRAKEKELEDKFGEI